jgi:hypothetical protein
VAGATLIAPLQEVEVPALDAATIQSMTIADTQQQLLERLRRAGDQPVTLPSCAPVGLTSRPSS